MGTRIYRQKGAKTYTADLRALGGKRVNTYCETLSAARVVYRRLEREAVTGPGDDGLPPPVHTVREAIHHLLRTTQARSDHYRTRGAHLIAGLGELDVNKIRAEDVTDYLRARLAQHGRELPPPPEHPTWKPLKVRVSTHTLHKELMTLGRALRLARRRKLFAGHVEDLMPDDFSSGYRPRERWLTPEELVKLLGALNPRRRLWVTLACYLGARSSEVSGLRWEDIEGDRAHLLGTKTHGSDRWVPIPKTLSAVLRPMSEPGPWRSGYGARRGLLVGGWASDCRDLTKACKRAGIPRVTPNDLRRTYASLLAQEGVTSLAIARLLGHSTTAMTDRVYSRLSAGSLAHAVENLPELDSK